LRVVTPSDRHLEEIDTEWPTGRRPTDWHHAWRWKELAAGKVEVLAVVGANDKAVGIWCSAKHKPIRLPDGLFYRPDYLEVAPAVLGQELGVFLFLLIAARALELGADRVVLGTWEILRDFYRGLGGVEGKPRGWNLESNLVPFTFDRETLEGLAEALEGKEDHGQKPPNI
jgi:GNAT superfamily N-acetyltransferase